MWKGVCKPPNKTLESQGSAGCPWSNGVGLGESRRPGFTLYTGWILKSSCRRATHLVHGTTCNWNPLSKSNFLQNFNSPLLYRVYYHLHGGIIGRGWMKEKHTEALQSPIDSKQVQHLWGKQMSPQLIGLGMDSGQSWPAQPTEA